MSNLTLSYELLWIIPIGLALWLYGAKLHRKKSNIAQFPKLINKITRWSFDEFGLICQLFAIWIWSRALVSINLVTQETWNTLGTTFLTWAVIILGTLIFLGKWIGNLLYKLRDR